MYNHAVVTLKSANDNLVGIQIDHASSATAPATAALEQPMPTALVHKQQPKSQLQTKAPVVALHQQVFEAAASKQPVQQRSDPALQLPASCAHIYTHASGQPARLMLASCCRCCNCSVSTRMLTQSSTRLLFKVCVTVRFGINDLQPAHF